LAYSPTVCIFFQYICHHSQLLIICFSAAFFWLLSLLINALLWFIIPPFYRNDYALIPVSVIIVDIMRLIFIYYYQRFERSFTVVSINALIFPLNDFTCAIASGVGYGFLTVSLYSGILISHSAGPGSIFLSTCPNLSLFVLSAWNGLCLSILEIALMIIAFDGMRILNIQQIIIVTLAHLSVSCMNIFNRTVTNGCHIAMPLQFGLTIVFARYAYRIARENNYQTRKIVNRTE